MTNFVLLYSHGLNRHKQIHAVQGQSDNSDESRVGYQINKGRISDKYIHTHTLLSYIRAQIMPGLSLVLRRAHAHVRVCVLPGGQSAQGAHGHRVGGALPAHVLEGGGQWAVAVQQVVGHHQGERRGHAEVRHKADEQRGHDADGDGPLGVLHLLACRGRRRVGRLEYGRGEVREDRGEARG